MKPPTPLRAALCVLACATAAGTAAADFLGVGPRESPPAASDDGLANTTAAYFSVGNPAAAFTLSAWLYSRPHGGAYSPAPLGDTALAAPAVAPPSPGRSGVAPTPGAGGGGSSAGGSGAGRAVSSPSGMSVTGVPSLAAGAGPVAATGVPALGWRPSPPTLPFVSPSSEGATAVWPRADDAGGVQAAPEPAGWTLALAGLGLTAAAFRAVASVVKWE